MKNIMSKVRTKFKNAISTARKYSEEIITCVILGCITLHAVGYFIRSIKM